MVNAGYDPVDFLVRYAGRVQLLHIKDLIQTSPTAEFYMRSVAVGQGNIDWPSVLRAVRLAGVKRGFVEVELPARPSNSWK